MDYDLFNGDADGICALLQLRKAEPRESQIVTGVKRDINLLGKIDANAGDRVTVLDVSMDKNKAPLVKALAAGATVFYVDHHKPGDIPGDANLTAVLDDDVDVLRKSLEAFVRQQRVHPVEGRTKAGHDLVHVHFDELVGEGVELGRDLAHR